MGLTGSVPSLALSVDSIILSGGQIIATVLQLGSQRLSKSIHTIRDVYVNGRRAQLHYRRLIRGFHFQRPVHLKENADLIGLD